MLPLGGGGGGWCVFYFAKLYSGFTRFVCSCLSLLCAPAALMGLCSSLSQLSSPQLGKCFEYMPMITAPKLSGDKTMTRTSYENKQSVSGCLVRRWCSDDPFFFFTPSGFGRFCLWRWNVEERRGKRAPPYRGLKQPQWWVTTCALWTKGFEQSADLYTLPLLYLVCGARRHFVWLWTLQRPPSEDCVRGDNELTRFLFQSPPRPTHLIRPMGNGCGERVWLCTPEC